MKTSHEFARELLALPDIVVAIYENSPEEPMPHDPMAEHVEGWDLDGEDAQVIEIYGKAPVVANGPDAKHGNVVAASFAKIAAPDDKLSIPEQAQIIKMVEDLISDSGHSYSESITAGFELGGFKIEITTSKIQ